MMVILRMLFLSVLGWCEIFDIEDSPNLTDPGPEKYAQTADNMQKLQEKQALPTQCVLAP